MLPDPLEQFRKSVKRFSDKNCSKNNKIEQFVDCPSEAKTALVAFLFVLLLGLLDQTVKYVIITYLTLGQQIDILPFLTLYHVQNNGIAFSMLASFNDWGLIGLTVAVMLFIIVLWWKIRHAAFWEQCGYLLVLGGAAGNLIDRVRFSYVTDYILLSYQDWSFAVFNLADIFITIGAVMIIGREVLMKTPS